MPNSPRLAWPYPESGSDPWFPAFEAMVNAMDASSYASREDRNVSLMGGGVMSFVEATGLFSWGATLQILSAPTGFLTSVAAGSATLNDGEILYVNLTRSPTNNVTTTALVALKVPSTDAALFICIRRGNRLYFRTGAVLFTGESTELIGTGGAGPRDGDLVKAPVAATNPTVGVDYVTAGGAPNTLDGVGLGLGFRILLKDQTTPALNGIYVVTVVGTGANGTWVRASDADADGELKQGTSVFVTSGTIAADRTYSQIQPDPILIGVTGTIWVQTGGSFGIPGQKLRQTIPFSLGNDTDQATDVVLGNFSLDPSDYNVAGTTKSFTFLVSAFVTSGLLTGHISLWNLTDAVQVGADLLITALLPTKSSAVFVPVAAPKMYEVRFNVAGGAGPTDRVFAQWTGVQIDNNFS